MNVQEFIQNHKDKSVTELSLLLSKKPELPKEFIINQINGRKRAKAKFPFLLEFPDFEFPNSRAIAQASSEQTAQFKASLFSGDCFADLSGGMGLDSFFFAKQFKSGFYLEQNEELFKTTSANFNVLEANNIEPYNLTAEQFIRETEQKFDLVYADPDRRASKTKAFKVDDCEPKLNHLLPLIWSKTNHCLVKLSPMLDIKQAIGELKNCKTVYVVAVKNDCKELLFHLEKDFSGEPEIKTTNIGSNQKQEFHFSFEEEQNANASLDEPQQFLLDPNVAILKAGAFKTLSQKLKIPKIGVNTHLYTSDKIQDNFPGRQFKVVEEIKLKKGKLKQANVISKNYPLKAEQIKSRFKIRDGGGDFIIAFSDLNNRKRVFKCEIV